METGMVPVPSATDIAPPEEISSEEEDLPDDVKYRRFGVSLRPPFKQVKQKKISDVLKPKTPVKKHYFSAAAFVHGGNKVDLDKEPSPFSYPEDLETFAHKVMTKAWRKDLRAKELKMPCRERPSYQMRQKRNLLNRLYVPEPSVKGNKTMTDINPEFYTIVEGRPINERFSIRKYVQSVKDVLRTKIVNGFRQDDILSIEENLLLEQQTIEEIKVNYQMYVNAFEEFLFKDHTTSMKLLQQSEAESAIAYEKYEECKQLTREYGALRSALYNSEEKWRNCKMYQKFLYMISPLTWRRENDYSFKIGDQFTTTGSEQESDDLFGKYRLELGEHGYSLNDLINQFNDDCRLEETPQLYFTDPEQLMDVFRFIEMQNLNSLLHSEELAIPLESVKEGMKQAEEMFDIEIKGLQETIAKLEGGILWQEERAKYLEELGLSLIENEFKKLTIDEDVLNLHVFVEDCYETRIGPNDANLSVGEMMKAIEEKYRYELLLLDKMPSEQVSLLEGDVYKEESRIMRLAEQAARQYNELERLTYRVGKAFAPPFQKSGRELKKRSPPINPPKPVPPPPRPLTEKEAEYLNYFTDYCAATDNLKQYGINTDADETEDFEKVTTVETEAEEDAEDEVVIDVQSMQEN